MKTLLLLLSLAPLVASAGTLDCRGGGVSYSISWPNGGAPDPTERLVVKGQLLIYRAPDITQPVSFASWKLEGPQTVTGTDEDRNSKTTYFTQDALVEGPHAALHPPLEFFHGTVNCWQVDSKLPPLP